MLEGLAGRRLLILLDNGLLDDATRRVLEAAGSEFEVATGDRGRTLLKEPGFSGAIIDIDIEASIAVSLAEKLEKKSIPFVFALNEGAPGRACRFSIYRLCPEPAELEAISNRLFPSESQ